MPLLEEKVDDLPAALGLHQRDHFAGEQKRSLAVDGKDAVPLLLGEFLHTPLPDDPGPCCTPRGPAREQLQVVVRIHPAVIDCIKTIWIIY